mmetsp:Transcript_4405/g.16062  ORF Transcript_4405/g.16062 Transcript_4405/m.16062 type:complete len:287 (-) Transcript_4405:489-1349(-)
MQQAPYHALRLPRDILGELERFGQQRLISFLCVLLVKGRQPHQHLVDEDPQRPPVCLLPVPLVQQDLWCHVVGRPDHAECTIVPAVLILAVSEVSEADVALVVEQDVLRLQVSVDDAHLMKILQRQDYLSSIEASARLREDFLPCDVGEQLPPVDEVHHKAQPVGCLECVMKLDDERMVHNFKSPPLSLGGLNEPTFVDRLVDVYDSSQVLALLKLSLKLGSVPLLALEGIFRDDLHRINLSGINLSHLQDFSIGSFPDDAQALKVGDGNSFFSNPKEALDSLHPF